MLVAFVRVSTGWGSDSSSIPGKHRVRIFRREPEMMRRLYIIMNIIIRVLGNFYAVKSCDYNNWTD